LGAAHISIEGCTIKGVSSAGGGTGYLGRNVVACIGGDYIQVLDCSLSFGAENDMGGGGSAVSLHQPYSFDTTPGIHMRIERNKMFKIGNPATANPATDRNGIILDQYHTVSGYGAPYIDNRLVGDTLIANNIIMNTAGRGIHVLVGGLPDSKIGIINNTVIAPFGYALGGSIPQCGIGGYGQGMFSNVTFFNNLVIGDQGRFNYDWVSWDSMTGAIQGARNWSYNGTNSFSPTHTEPTGWLYSTANPLLVNPTNDGTGNYSPQAGSPLIGAGLATFNGWSAPAVDFNGATRTGNPTIGAIQINSGVGSAPVANFTFSPAIPGAGSQVTFTNTSTNSPNSFQWSFGDGTTSLLTNPTKIYTGAGTYTVTLTVSNSFGANTISKSITIAPAGGTGTTPGTAVNLFNLFNSIYPCAAALIWVDSAGGNDSNPGTQAAPKQTLQGGVNAANAGTRIMLRPGTYGGANLSGKHGTAGNWIQVVGEPGAVINSDGDGQGTIKVQGCSFWAFYGIEMVGIYAGGSDIYEVAFYQQFGAHSIAVWNCHIHHWSSHAYATNGAARFDVCYNRLHHLAKWNPYQTSAISGIGMPNVGSAWPDGYHNRVIGNVIDAIWTEESAVAGSPWGITDGNGLILDYSAGYTGRTLAARNLIVGCGGRGLHALGTDHCDFWNNTSLDNSQNLDGSWIGEISITTSTDSHAAWNVAAARPGSNRVGIFQDAGTSTWSDTVFLRGTGGSEANDPSVNAYNNIDKTAVGPAGYFQQYQPGVSKGTSITNVAGFRPTSSQVATFTPPANVRAALAAWPDPLGFLPPATGVWAYGAFEATTTTSAPPDDPPDDPPPPPPPSSGALTVEAESGTVGGGATVITDNPGYLGSGYIGFWGNTGDFNQITVVASEAGPYNFRIRYGNAHLPAQAAQARVVVNGTEAAIVQMPNTASSWSDSTRFQFTGVIQITLNAGSNTIRIEHTGAEFSYADLDQYVFETTTTTPPGGTGSAPVAVFAFSPTIPLVGQAISFVDQTSNAPTSWAWNFGDGTTSTQQSPVKSYTSAGTYTITLTATNAQGSNSTTRSITVVAATGVTGQYQYQVTGSPLANGTNYTVKVEVRDAMGLTSSDTEDFATSWTAPTAPSFTVNP
jgi:PKD repeat protein